MRTTYGLLALLFIVGVACQSKTTSKEQLKSGVEETLVTYEYVYPGNTADLIENHYIKLKQKGDSVTGKYYGTSDEFDDAREGYLPGFFVADMVDIQFKGDSIRFTLRCSNEEMFTKPVDLKVGSADEARSQGYAKWDIGLGRNEQKYAGYIHGDTIIMKSEFGDRLFTRMK